MWKVLLMLCKKLHTIIVCYTGMAKMSKLTSRSATVVISIVSVFAALDVALGAIPGWWVSWAAIIKPLHGIMLGPIAGPYAAIIGGLIGNFIWPLDCRVICLHVGSRSSWSPSRRSANQK